MLVCSKMTQEAVVFSMAANNDIKTYLPVHWRVPYVKRCVGLPGDTIRIRNGEINVFDSEKDSQSRKLYQVYTQSLNKNDIEKLTQLYKVHVMKKEKVFFYHFQIVNLKS